MNNYIILGQLFFSTLLYSAILKNEYIKYRDTHYELEKTKKYLEAYIKKENIKKPTYDALSEQEKQILANILIKLKKDNKELYEFSKKLILFTKKSNLRNFENNITKLKIYKNKKNKLLMFIKNDYVIGTYEPIINIIKIHDDKKTTLTHELLHTSSSNPKYISIGFNTMFNEVETNLKYDEFGRGLNEGYTELLNNRISKGKSYSYLFLNKIAYLIEQIFENKEDMKNYYFNNNIEGIIYELYKYIDEKEIIELLINIDELYYTKSILIYFKIKKKLMKIVKENKSEKEIENFEKEYHNNHLIKIMRKTL